MIPQIKSIKNTYSLCFNETTIVVKAQGAGRAARYNVMRIRHDLGTIRCIGRKLAIADARLVAKRPADSDGEPIMR